MSRRWELESDDKHRVATCSNSSTERTKQKRWGYYTGIGKYLNPEMRVDDGDPIFAPAFPAFREILLGGFRNLSKKQSHRPSRRAIVLVSHLGRLRAPPSSLGERRHRDFFCAIDECASRHSGCPFRGKSDSDNVLDSQVWIARRARTPRVFLVVDQLRIHNAKAQAAEPTWTGSDGKQQHNTGLRMSMRRTRVSRLLLSREIAIEEHAYRASRPHPARSDHERLPIEETACSFGSDRAQ